MTARPLWRQTGVIVKNDLRLLWREYLSRRKRMFATWALLGLVLVGGHVLAFFLFGMLRQPPPLAIEGAIWLFFGFFILGSTMNTAIGLLYERADFDLLLSSPLNPRAVLLARLLSLGTSGFLSVALFLLPLLNAASVRLSPKYVAGFFVWILLAALAAAFGISLTLSLVKLLGVRRARVTVQITAAVLGASVFLTSQVPRFLPESKGEAVLSSLISLAQHPALTAIARAARGEPGPIAGLSVLTVAAVILATRSLSRIFVSGSQDATVALGGERRSRPSRRYRWAEGLRLATFRKDLRLIARDPLLLAQILPSALYLIPGLFSFGRGGGIELIAPVAAVIAPQFSMLLTAVAASGEEGWDLIRMSPSSEIQLRIAKMMAGMALPLLLALMICLLLVFVGRPGLAAITLLTSIIAASACSWLQVTVIRPTARRDVIKRRGGASLARGIVSGAHILAAALGVGMLSRGYLLPGAFALLILLLGALACFTFARPKEIALSGDEAPAPSPP